MDYDDAYDFPDATENIFFENVRDDDAIAFGAKGTPKKGRKKALSIIQSRHNSPTSPADIEIKQHFDDDNGDEEDAKQLLLKDAKPAVHRKVKFGFDSDDEFISKCKDEGRTNRDIARLLKENGRTRYSEKSIHSRFQRLVLSQQERYDELLRMGAVHWTYEDDEKLLLARDNALKKIADMIGRLRQQEWKFTSDELFKLDNKSRYSDKACEERYLALMTGMAEIPIMLHDNPVEVLERSSRKTAEGLALKQQAAELNQALLYEKHLMNERFLAWKSRTGKKRKLPSTEAIQVEKKKKVIDYWSSNERPQALDHTKPDTSKFWLRDLTKFVKEVVDGQRSLGVKLPSIDKGFLSVAPHKVSLVFAPGAPVFELKREPKRIHEGNVVDDMNGAEDMEID